MDVKSDNEWLWSEYYDAFPYFEEQNIRKGCHPRKLIHDVGAKKAIVLIHGLSDSSYFMADLAEHFHKVLGYDVYVPLLQCHGLKSPNGMEGVSLAEWKKNVCFAIDRARENSDYVSIGGLSTGGALAFNLGCTDHRVTGDIYLFAAAFGLASGSCSFCGRFKEAFLRIPFLSILEPKKSLIGDNPYRYSRVSINSAAELAHLMLENNRLLQGLGKGQGVGKRFFSAWSEYDDVVDVKALESLKGKLPQNGYSSFVIPREFEVGHACLVLKEPVYAIGAELKDRPLEPANPLFDDMLSAIARHESING